VRAELIGGERAASHLRAVQASFAAAITEFAGVASRGCAGHRLDGGGRGCGAGSGTGCGGGELGLWWLIGDLGQIVASSVNLVRSGLASLR
jgi:hypothetical protein